MKSGTKPKIIDYTCESPQPFHYSPQKASFLPTLKRTTQAYLTYWPTLLASQTKVPPHNPPLSLNRNLEQLVRIENVNPPRHESEVIAAT